MDRTNLKFLIEENLQSRETKVTLTFSNSIRGDIHQFLMNLFPIEFYSAVEKTVGKESIISIDTKNKEMVDSLKKMIMQWFRQRSKLNNINLN